MAIEALEQHEHYFFRFRSSRSFVLITVCVAIFNDVFLFGTLIPILPYALPERIHVNEKDVQMCIATLLAVYGGALLVGALLFGWIGGKLGRRRTLFLLGLSMLLVATCILAAGRHLIVLTLGRILQGFSAAVVWTSGLGLLTDLFDKDRYGEAIGYTQTAVSIGTTVAPLCGGVVYSRAGYQAVSAMSIGVVTFCLILALTMIESRPEDQLRDSPFCSNSTEAIEERSSIRPETQSLSQSENEQTLLLRSKIKKYDFENRSAYLLLLGSGRVLAAMIGLFTYTFIIISFEGIIPSFVKNTFHWNSFYAALIFLSWIIPGFLGPIAGKASDRLGPKWTAIGGFLFTAPPLILMRFVTNNTISHQILLCIMLALVGFGLVWVLPSCISDLQNAAADIERKNPRQFGKTGASSQAFGLVVFSWSLGSLIGPPVSSIINEKVDWASATLLLAIASVVACFPIAFGMLGSSPRNSSALF